MSRMESVLTKDKVNINISKYELLIVFISFFLGRVTIIENLTPFGIAFLGAYIILKRGSRLVLLATMLGTFSVQGISGMNYYMASILIYWFFTRYKENKRYNLITSATISSTLFIIIKIVLLYISKNLFIYDSILLAFEGILIFTMTYVFSFGVPIVAFGKKEISNEKMICTFLTFALALSGLGNLSIIGVSLKNVISLTSLIYLGYKYGIYAGGTAGIVLGMISYVSNVEMPFIVAILGVGGILSGLFKDLGKGGSVLGLILGNGIISYYINGLGTSFLSIRELIIGSLLFLFLSNTISNRIEKIVISDNKVRADYENRKFQLASKKLMNISELLDQLAATFKEDAEEKDVFSSYDIYNLVDDVKNSKCKNCSEYFKCWKDDYYTTYYSLFTVMGIMESNVDNKDSLIESIMHKCSDEINEAIKNVYGKYREKQELNKRYMDQRMVLIEQLEGLGKMLNNLNLNIYGTSVFNPELEELLFKEIKNNRIDINDLIVAQLEDDNIEIYMEFDSNNSLEKAELVTKIVSEALGYPVSGDYSYGAISSSNRFKLVRYNRYGSLTKVSSLANSEDGISGDNFTFGEVENTSFIALSDGMGTGKKASEESSTAIELLERMMEINLDKDMIIKTINSIIRTKSDDEIFTTLDLSFIDLYSGKLQVVKSGAPPTFIKRRDQVHLINSMSLPIGILKDVEFNIYEENIEDGDIIIMVSDGILESNSGIENPEEWLKDIILNLESQNPQFIADEIINIVKEESNNYIRDDMTVLVTKVWKN